MNDLFGRIHLDFRSSEPIFLQIARQIEGFVREGSLKQGDQLPTVRELATELRINFSTVARAYKLLDEERLISTQRGRGTYIWEEPTPETTEHIRRKTLEELASQYLTEASKLGYSPAEALEILTTQLRAEQVGSDTDTTVK